jgi:predicted TIM-barrel fold metal-dependent hydrolase
VAQSHGSHGSAVPFQARDAAVVDVHVHVHTGDRRRERLAQSEDARRLFGSGAAHGPDEVLTLYQQLGGMAVVFDVDAETSTGQKISNDEIAELVARSGGRLVGFGSVDPWKGRAAVKEVERCHKLGMKGMKFQPITQAFFANEPRFSPIWDACQGLGLIVIFHTGTTAIGNGAPGGRGLHLKYGRPIPALDDVAAWFPDLTIIAAHPGWPWHTELLAVARHKGNVYIDLSGWAPRYWPAETVQYLNSVMPEKFLFGSDYPLFHPRRWLDEFAQLSVKDGVREKVLRTNALGLLRLA